jgi:hypothetical protein
LEKINQHIRELEAIKSYDKVKSEKIEQLKLEIRELKEVKVTAEADILPPL